MRRCNSRRRVTVRWRSATLCGNRPQPQRRASGAEWQDGNAISQASNASFGICADIIARVCANLLPGRLRARGQSVREHGSAVDQMRSHRLRRGFSKAVRPVLRPYARAPKKRGARPPAAHSAYLRGRRSDPPHLASPAQVTDGRTAIGICIDSTASGARCEWSVNDKGEIDICNKNGCVYCSSATSQCTGASRTRPRSRLSLPVGAVVMTPVGIFSVKPRSFDLRPWCPRGQVKCPLIGCVPIGQCYFRR